MGLFKKIKKNVGQTVSAAVNAVSQSENRLLNTCDSSENIKRLSRLAGAEGIVMLKNENNALPLSSENVVSVFGRVQKDWFYVGYGSGGDVKPPYRVSLLEAMREDGSISLNEELAGFYEAEIEKNPAEDGFWGHWPTCREEIDVPLSLVQKSAEKGDTAVTVIGRAAGEDRDNTLTKGSYYLSDREKVLLDRVTSSFKKVVLLLNCGSIMDMSFLADYGDKISAVLYVWQGGMESGHSVCDVLSGRISPCGKLSDTIAASYSNYPSSKNFGHRKYNIYSEDIFVGYRYFETFSKSRVLFPFGFGLSYTDFEMRLTSSRTVGDTVTLRVNIKNSGEVYSAKQVVQAYVRAPQGRLSKPEAVLAAFEKTKLLAPGEEDRLSLTFDLSDIASFDDSGKSGEKNAWVLERGDYEIYVGSDVRSAKRVKIVHIPSTRVCKKVLQACAPDPSFPFDRLIAAPDGFGGFEPMLERAPVMRESLKDRILNSLPVDIPQTGDMGYKLCDVKSGKVSMRDFVAQLSFKELEAITRGDYQMDSPLGAKGNAGAIGGVLPSLRKKGIPPVITTDGPSGMRLSATCTLLPNGTALACTFNKALIEELFCELAKEMKDRGSDILLAPGMNIHRDPLCGRNFEYFSEDPYLSGMIAASCVKGIQSGGLSACPKHFACNNQETNRTHNDSRVSQRALREIYLRGFEICIRESDPKNIMTSYNKINGVWSHYNYDLCTTILRGEWGYRGNVMTDWWMRPDESHEFRKVRDQGYRVRAQVDVLMPGASKRVGRKSDKTLKKSMKAKNGVTLGEIQRSAINVLNMAMLKINNDTNE